MRNFILISLIFLASKANSQIIEDFSLTSGVTISNINYEILSIRYNYKPVVGFTSNLRINFFRHSNWSIISKIGVTQIGGKLDLPFYDNKGEHIGNTTSRAYFNYLSLSPCFKLKHTFGEFEPFVYLGPRIDYLLSATYGSLTPFNKYNTGIDLGCGVLFSLKSNLKLALNLEYEKRVGEILEYIKAKGCTNIELGFFYSLKDK